MLDRCLSSDVVALQASNGDHAMPAGFFSFLFVCFNLAVAQFRADIAMLLHHLRAKSLAQGTVFQSLCGCVLCALRVSPSALTTFAVKM